MGAGHVQVDIRLKQRREGNYRDFCGTPFCRQSVSEHKTVEGRRVLHTPLSVHIGELLYMSKIHQISSSYTLGCYWACHGGRWIVRCWRVPSVVLTRWRSKPTCPFGWMSSWWNVVCSDKTAVCSFISQFRKQSSSHVFTMKSVFVGHVFLSPQASVPWCSLQWQGAFNQNAPVCLHNTEKTGNSTLLFSRSLIAL